MNSTTGTDAADRAIAAGDLHRAIELLRKAAKANPGEIAQWMKLAALHRATRDLPMALDAVHQALSISPFLLNTAGHSSIVDALALGVPVLAYPAAGHFEQELNARALVALGCGGHLRGPDAAAIRAFAHTAERMAPARLGLPDNAAFFRALDGALAEVVRP